MIYVKRNLPKLEITVPKRKKKKDLDAVEKWEKKKV